MEMYKITIEQKEELQNKKFNDMYFYPIQDISGDWFISEIEKSYCEKHFKWELVLTEFVPVPSPFTNLSDEEL